MKKSLACLSFALSGSLFCMGHKVNVNHAIDDAVRRYGLRTEPSLIQAFKRSHVQYPPQQITLLAFKKERHIELWAKDAQGQKWKYIQDYPLTAFSGHLGPKLRERDGQIPEGIYHLTSFNPYSSWHLSMMIDYPNSFDQQQAQKEGRRQLGGDIFLHGKDKSVGCLAIGDKAIDQLFLLVRRVGLSHVKLIIAPNDLRQAKPATVMLNQPKWVPILYQKIAESLAQFKKRRNERV